MSARQGVNELPRYRTITPKMATQYPLGTTDLELERLRFQHKTWGDVTRAFLERMGLSRGWNVLDLGCGPGFVSFEIAERVGRTGSVIALDESPRWLAFLAGEIAARK